MKSQLRHYLLVTFGGAIQGIAMAIFLFPHYIPSGGAGGLAVLLNYWFYIPLSLALWLVNFSLLVVAIKWLGNSSAIGTMYSITITSFTVKLFEIAGTQETFSNVWIDLLLGGVLLGVGVGILLKQNVSNGGIGVLALVFSKYRGGAPGSPLFWMNGFIFLLTASIINWQIIIQALICQWVSTRMVNFVHHFDLTPYHSVSYRNKK